MTPKLIVISVETGILAMIGISKLVQWYEKWHEKREHRRSKQEEELDLIRARVESLERSSGLHYKYLEVMERKLEAIAKEKKDWGSPRCVMGVEE